MAITTGDQAINAIANNSQLLHLSKSSIINTASGQYISHWRATGTPAQGAIPTTWAACSRDTTGAFPFTEAVSPAETYLSNLEIRSDIAPQTHFIVDRIAHMGGLVGNVTTAQTVSADLSTLLATENIAERIGNSNYSELAWYLEWYADTGSTPPSATLNATYDDGTTGNLTAITITATTRASRMLQINPLIPSAAGNRRIRGINTLTLSVSSGTAGNFGITVVRYLGSVYAPLTQMQGTKNWVDLNLPKVARRACLAPMLFTSSTQTGGQAGMIQLSNG